MPDPWKNVTDAIESNHIVRAVVLMAENTDADVSLTVSIDGDPAHRSLTISTFASRDKVEDTRLDGTSEVHTA